MNLYMYMKVQIYRCTDAHGAMVERQRNLVQKRLDVVAEAEPRLRRLWDAELCMRCRICLPPRHRLRLGFRLDGVSARARAASEETE